MKRRSSCKNYVCSYESKGSHENSVQYMYSTCTCVAVVLIWGLQCYFNLDHVNIEINIQIIYATVASVDLSRRSAMDSLRC